MNTDLIKRILILTFSIFISYGFVSAQVAGSLAGTVHDPNGAVVPGAAVTLRNDATNLTRTTITNDEGRWTVTSLPVGAYVLSFEKTGFKKATTKDAAVEASVTRTIDVTLEIGVSDVFVDVTSDQPLVQGDSATTARQITGEEVTKIPTSTRSFTALLSSEAGVSSELSPVGVNGNGNISPSVNGTRTTSTSLFFNGIDATNITSNEGSLNDNISPAPETLQEVKLQTSLYDASTGRSGGGNFQLVTKSGGNHLSGSAYYYLQNKAFNTNDFFLREAGVEKPRADRTETGFTIGGPIKKDRFFFFGGYQFTNANTGLVPTARTRTVLPRALTVLGNDRSRAAIAAAFNQFNGCNAGPTCLTPGDISDLAFNIFNIQNPVTGGFMLPYVPDARRLFLAGSNTPLIDQSGNGTFQFGSFPTVTSRLLARSNQLVELIAVQPSLFKQHQATIRFDGQLSDKNTLSGTFFYADFPGLDSFPDPNSLASPFTLRRGDRNRTVSVGDTHILTSNWVNEVRVGYFYLNNTRSLDDPFLTDPFTNAFVGIQNPASQFDSSPATTRLGHFIGRNNIANFSFGGPNDSFNKRKQITYSIGDNVSWTYGNHSIKFGGEYKRHQYDTNLPEEQATEFEKFDNFTQLLTGNATEADTQYGVTDKSFRFQDYGFYIADNWKINRRLSLNLGLRYELFMWPIEKDGRIGNFDLEPFMSCFNAGGTNSLCDNPTPGFIVPSNVGMTGNAVVDGAIAATQVAGNKHTLRGQDLNNFAPRVGLAYSVNDRLVIRGGYGLFYDRPSAAFINTVFSNYPFLREVEITVPSTNVPITSAFSGVPTNIPLNQWLPFRIIRSSGASGTYQIRDNTPVFVDSRGVPQGAGCNIATGANCVRGNIAETFEFRAIDRNLRTPYVHQWNVGAQYEIFKDLMIEARYIGTSGKNLLIAQALNQGYDLNDPSTPDHIFQRFIDAYVAAGSPNGALNSGATARERGLGRAFGFANPYAAGLTPGCTAAGVLTLPSGSPIDLNLANSITCGVNSAPGATSGIIGGGQVINFEARVPILGFNVPEALLLQSNGYSNYHGAQFSLTKRLSRGLQFNIAYTFSKSIDVMSSDPGSTAGSGKPDVPNSGFIAQGDSRNLESNRGLSDFDRTHRFSTNFVWEIPSFRSDNRFLSGWSISGFFQAQSGTPFTVFASEPEIASASQYADLTRGSGGLYRLGFGRPNISCTAEEAIAGYSTDNVIAFDRSCFSSPRGGFGNLGRNTFRGPMQKRFDISFAKNTKITERLSLELGFDIFNLFNTVNFANPNSDLQDAVDFGVITNTIGGPRIGQFRAKLRF